MDCTIVGFAYLYQRYSFSIVVLGEYRGHASFWMVDRAFICSFPMTNFLCSKNFLNRKWLTIP